MKKILIADDSEVFRRLEEAFLMNRGYELVHASDGAEAVRKTFQEKPDLVLLDIQMPVMDGVQVLSTLKANPATREIPVIVISTIGREQDKDILTKGGADGILPKPINGLDLVRKVRELVGE